MVQKSLKDYRIYFNFPKNLQDLQNSNRHFFKGKSEGRNEMTYLKAH